MGRGGGLPPRRPPPPSPPLQFHELHCLPLEIPPIGPFASPVHAQHPALRMAVARPRFVHHSHHPWSTLVASRRTVSCTNAFTNQANRCTKCIHRPTCQAHSQDITSHHVRRPEASALRRYNHPLIKPSTCNSVDAPSARGGIRMSCASIARGRYVASIVCGLCIAIRQPQASWFSCV